MLIDTKYFYFHIDKDMQCTECCADISLSWFRTKPSDRWNYEKRHKFTLITHIFNRTFFMEFKL